MRIVIYTQRVEIVASYGERRDCADQMIPKFLRSCDITPIPMPNVPSLVQEIISELRPTGIFFSGGNDLVKYGGNAPERDETERRLLDWALENDRAVFGICRGMQFIANYFGAELSPVDNHVGRRHKILGAIARDEVNSFHKFGLTSVPNELEVLARAEDNSIEAFRHKKFRIAAVGWHPEREINFDDEDIHLIKNFFGEVIS